MFHKTLTLVALVLFAGALRAADELPTLDQALRANAEKIVKQLKEEKYKNVGVLKFTVRSGDGPARDNVGPLNTSLADRLEVALVLALDDDSLGIISNASKGVAESGNERATHLTAKGRKELFAIKDKYFSVPWRAGQPVKPDAFLIGEARLAPNRRSLTVVIQVFDRDNLDKPKTIAEFPAAADLRTLTETGVTFASRGAFDNPDVVVAKATEAAPQPDDKPEVLQKKAEQALADLKQSPIKVEILYDKDVQAVQAAPISADQGNTLLQVKTPKTTQKVAFRLTNTDRDTYGVVFKINGHNTIKSEQQDALDCKKWILKPGDKITIHGFQLNDKEADPFAVQTPFESDLNSVYYGDNAGTYSLVVFRAAKEKDVIVKADPVLATISRGMVSLHGEPKATNLKGLQDQLKKEAGEDAAAARSRGLVTGSGTVGNSPVEQVEFTPLPIPVLSATIRYFEPRKK